MGPLPIQHTSGPPLDASSVMWPGEWTIPSVGTVTSFVVVRPDYVAIVPTRFIARKKSTAVQAAQQGHGRASADNQLGGFILHVTRPTGLRGPTG